jgi:hypothetical protein
MQGTNPTAGQEQKRTFHLNNGGVIWDFAGNIQQWVKGSRSELGLSTGVVTAVSWAELNSIVTTSDRMIFGAANNSYTSTLNIGKIYGGPTGTDGIARGGKYSDQAGAGIYAVYLTSATAVDSTVGFRCVYIK